MKDKAQRRNKNRIEKEYVLERNYEKLGQYLAEGRQKAGLTQREVSLTLGYSSAQFISNFERGISSPPLAKLRELIQMYKLDHGKVIKMLTEATKEIFIAELTS